MIATQFILLAATAVAPLASNAAPIFSGMFSKFARRADSNVQLAQGTNFFFSNLHLEDTCQAGQIACISGNLATCSQESNWEITPCTNNTSCFAVPNSANTNIDVKCMAESDADSAIQQAGGSGGVSVDFQVTSPPFPNTDSDPAPTDGGDNGDNTDAPSATDAPTATEDPNAPGETCIPDDGSDEGDNGDNGDGSDNGDNGDGSDGGDQNTDPTPTGTVAEDPIPTDLPAPTDGTCTDDEPEETETITLILVPNPTESGAYQTETFTGQFPDVTPGFALGPGGDPTEGSDDGSDGSNDAPTDGSDEGSNPTESCTESPSGEPTLGYSDGPADPAPTDAPSDGSDGLDGSDGSDNTQSPTTLTVGTPLPTTSAASGGVNVVGTHNIPAPPAPTRRSVMQKKVRRS